MNITQAQIRELLSYDEGTGVFTWLVSTAPRVKVGDIAGNLNKITRYVLIMINHKSYKAHRLAWLYVTGSFPSKHLDHINGVKHDNKWLNLREATVFENGYNKGRQANNTSGFKGVCWDKTTKKWRAKCKVSGKDIYLGRYTTPQEAADAYQAFAKEHHGQYFNRRT